MKEWMSECPDCGTPVKNYRGYSVHVFQGCPAAIFDLHTEGESVSSLARRFKKKKDRIRGIIRLEEIRRKMKGQQND